MHPPLSLGTILQNRYFLIDLLAQGKTGRTYLAKDQERLNEFCVLKEFIPEPTGETNLQQYHNRLREAAFPLFRLRHPQIPAFRTTFEQDGRLFLVREYVEGKSYRSLLRERKASALLLAADETDEELPLEEATEIALSEETAFSEEEVLQLLQLLLPVLDYIHSTGISHGNISPDNIIRRDRPLDNETDSPIEGTVAALPALIDFALEKQLVDRLTQEPLSPEKAVENPVQLTAERSPLDDLHALAVTAVVLLTGREPQQLFNQNQLRQEWQEWATVRSEFAQILNRMLSELPEARYQSAREVALALQSLNAPIHRTRRSAPRRQGWNYSWAYAVSIGMVLVVSVGSWAVLKYMLNPTQPPLPALPLGDNSPNPQASQPKRTPEVKAVTSSKPLDVEAGQKTTVKGTLKANEILTYIIRGQRGQQLNAALTSKGVLMTVFNPERKPIADRNKTGRNWKGGLFEAGDYYIQLRPLKASDRSEYKLDVSLNDYFPKTFCEEPASDSAGTWYPVFVDYSPQTISKLQSQYCRNTFLAPTGGAKGLSVQVAAFAERFQAEAFAQLLASEITSAKVGEAVTGNPPRSCSDRNSGATQTWYPVFTEYTKEKYVKILSFCPNASIAKRSNRNGSYIEVAAFLDRGKAVEMAAFIAREVGSAEVGEATAKAIKDPKSGT